MGTLLAHMTGKSGEWNQTPMWPDIEDHQDLGLLQHSLASFSQTFSLGAPQPQRKKDRFSPSPGIHISGLLEGIRMAFLCSPAIPEPITMARGMGSCD